MVEKKTLAGLSALFSIHLVYRPHYKTQKNIANLKGSLLLAITMVITSPNVYYPIYSYGLHMHITSYTYENGLQPLSIKHTYSPFRSTQDDPGFKGVT